jgi:hypothetical protein
MAAARSFRHPQPVPSSFLLPRSSIAGSGHGLLVSGPYGVDPAPLCQICAMAALIGGGAAADVEAARGVSSSMERPSAGAAAAEKAWPAWVLASTTPRGALEVGGGALRPPTLLLRLTVWTARGPRIHEEGSGGWLRRGAEGSSGCGCWLHAYVSLRVRASAQECGDNGG